MLILVRDNGISHYLVINNRGMGLKQMDCFHLSSFIRRIRKEFGKEPEG
jgi:hypothetical protein